MGAERQATTILIGPRNIKARKKKVQTLKLMFLRCEQNMYELALLMKIIIPTLH
jgi:hypothetical protein